MANPLTESDLIAIEARCEAATRGPWTVRDSIRQPFEFRPGATSPEHGVWAGAFQVLAGKEPHRDWGYAILHGDWHEGSTKPKPGDLDFIAAAREDVPRLVAEVRRLRGLLGKEAE